MRLVIDTNRILACTIKDGLSRRILLDSSLSFSYPDVGLHEILKHIPGISEKTRLPLPLLFSILRDLLARITIISLFEDAQSYEEAKRIMEPIDPDDAPFLACALAICADGIWTEDAHFDRQDRVRVWKTSDLLDYISLSALDTPCTKNRNLFK